MGKRKKNFETRKGRLIQNDKGQFVAGRIKLNNGVVLDLNANKIIIPGELAKALGL